MSTTARTPQAGHVIEAVVADPTGKHPKRRRLLVTQVPSAIPGKDFDALALSTRPPTDNQFDYCVQLSEQLCKRAKTSKDSYIKCYWVCNLNLSDIVDDDWGFVSNSTILNLAISLYEKILNLGILQQLRDE